MKTKNVLQFTGEDKKKINKLIEEKKFVMFEVHKGKVWYIPDHHRKINYVKDCGRRLVCTVKVPPDFYLIRGKYWYVTEKI